MENSLKPRFKKNLHHLSRCLLHSSLSNFDHFYGQGRIRRFCVNTPVGWQIYKLKGSFWCTWLLPALPCSRARILLWNRGLEVYTGCDCPAWPVPARWGTVAMFEANMALEDLALCHVNRFSLGSTACIGVSSTKSTSFLLSSEISISLLVWMEYYYI